MKKLVFIIYLLLYINATANSQINGDTLVEKQIGLICHPVQTTLNIDDFDSGKPFKVIVGEPIDYKLNMAGCSYNWDMNNVMNTATPPLPVFWPINQYLNPNTNVTGNVGKAIIPLSTTPTPTNIVYTLPESNLSFGTTNGQVTAVGTNPIDTDTKTVKVFYRKNDIIPNTYNMPPNTSSELVNGTAIDVPNWFYYWSQAPEIQNLITNIPGIKLFDPSTCQFENQATSYSIILEYSGVSYPYTGSFDVLGLGRFDVAIMELKDAFVLCGMNTPYNQVLTKNIANPNDNYIGIQSQANPIRPRTKIINIGEACGHIEPNDFTVVQINGQTPPQRKGIHVFYRAVKHEIEHLIIEHENWIDGYYTLPNPLMNPDADGDGYNDAWESMINLISYNSSNHCPAFFDPMNNDSYQTYNAAMLNKGTIILNQQSQTVTATGYNYSSGVEYEECRCRKVSNATSTYNTTLPIPKYNSPIDISDWSFDNLINGKQW